MVQPNTFVIQISSAKILGQIGHGFEENAVMLAFNADIQQLHPVLIYEEHAGKKRQRNHHPNFPLNILEPTQHLRTVLFSRFMASFWESSPMSHWIYSISGRESQVDLAGTFRSILPQHDPLFDRFSGLSPCMSISNVFFSGQPILKPGYLGISRSWSLPT